jgi:hypothetical protein
MRILQPYKTRAGFVQSTAWSTLRIKNSLAGIGKSTTSKMLFLRECNLVLEPVHSAYTVGIVREVLEIDED